MLKKIKICLFEQNRGSILSMNLVYKTFILILTFPYILFSQTQNIKFEQITVNQGLSQSGINCIFQDSYGYMWFGSQLGLKKFDGYKFTSYRYNPENEYSLSDNDIQSITEDKSGNLWIGTRYGGLNQYDRETDKFYRYRIDTSNHPQKTPIHVLSTLFDKTGQLWIGTENRGLFLLNLESHTLNNYVYHSGDNSGPSSNYICLLHEDREGNIWIGSHKGISRFNRKTEKFTHFKQY
jgi:ligand-binding sensor domain-containing protein